MPYLLRIPKAQLALILFLIYLSTFKPYPSFSNLYILFASVGSTIFFDLLFTFLKKKVFFIPYAALVTGLIIALIIDPNALWYQIAIICAIAMGFKNFVRISGRHIFNPASVGLFLGGVILNLNVSWWGVSFQDITQFNLWNLFFFFILLLPSFISFFRMRRFGSILSFIFTYTTAVNLMSSNFTLKLLLNTLLNPNIIFFATVLLPEPMTSPVNLRRQIFYGIIIAITTLILSYPLITTFLSNYRLLPDILILALLLGNILFFKYR